MAEGTNNQSMSEQITGRKIHINGIVQGVGFRPFVYNLARRYGLCGWVLNSSAGVDIEVEGPPAALDAFIAALDVEKPPLAVIDSLSVKEIPPNGYRRFAIRHSRSVPGDFVPISPDICICDDCRRELFDPHDRRYLYPFINCTNCGPRFTIIKDIPYDRPLTTMAVFTMCAECQAEYDDPANRRFHAQPNACPRCGPEVELQLETHFPYGTLRDPGDNGFLPRGAEAIATARELLRRGAIVAVKGLGGFHLACDATNDEALRTLRERKGRVDKPFAIMAFDVATVEHFCFVDSAERALLESRERPILLLRKRPDSPISSLVAPGNGYLGVMLPYTPLHYLLLADDGRPVPCPWLPALVMTSGNYSEEPIVKDDDEALERLSSLTDAFLLHNRDIHARSDDSVVRVLHMSERSTRSRKGEASAGGRVLPIRRSRGYAPFPVKLPFQVEQILAVGGELKNTFCLTKGNYAFMSQHIGDMENYETLQAFEQAVAHFCALFRAQPGIVAHDMHPGYLSTKWANSQGQILAWSDGVALRRPQGAKLRLKTVAVQHHHAHIAACMAEHGLRGDEPVIGISFDGTGYGPDPTLPGGAAIWGGEVLIADYAGYRRAAHLAYVPLPGGDTAIRKPYRTALAHLWAAGIEWDANLPPVAACNEVERGVIRHQLETGFNAVPTSSMGRLFDAVAAIAGLRQTITYEAQAAMEFENLAAEDGTDSYRFEIERAADRGCNPLLREAETGCRRSGFPGPLAQATAGQPRLSYPLIIHPAPVIRAVVADVRAAVPLPIISARFHNAVAGLIRDVCLLVCEREGLARVALSGGVFQNVTLLAKAERLLTKAGFEVLIHRMVPPNDGGIALGQAVISNFKFRSRS
jgi:hydrogenase maturation protein HypF